MQFYGRLAQPWLERLRDMQKVTRSSRVPPMFSHRDYSGQKNSSQGKNLWKTYWISL